MEDGLGKALILMPDAECIKRMHPLLSGTQTVILRSLTSFRLEVPTHACAHMHTPPTQF